MHVFYVFNNHVSMCIRMYGIMHNFVLHTNLFKWYKTDR